MGVCVLMCVCVCEWYEGRAYRLSQDIHSNSGGATHTGGGAKAPQNLKKLIYSMYIIYILKNIACKNWNWPPQILSYFNGTLNKKRNYIKII